MMNKTISIPADPNTDIACRPIDQQERPVWRKVIDRIADRCRSRSLFILHYCTGCGAIELPPNISTEAQVFLHFKTSG